MILMFWLEDFAEGKYRWLAPHDPEGLFDILGGPTYSLSLLDEMFEGMLQEDGLNPALPENWYWHGNEPGLQELLGYLHSRENQKKQSNGQIG